MRLLRQDIAKDMRRQIEVIDSLSTSEMDILAHVEREAIEFEDKFLELFTKKPSAEN